MSAISPSMKRMMTKLRYCCPPDRGPRDVATVLQDDLAAVLDLVDALLRANDEQAAVIERLTHPANTAGPVVDARICTRACEGAK